MMLPKITGTEFTKRRDRLVERMHERAIDMAVLFSNLLDPSAVRYFSDFSAVNESAAMVILPDKKTTLCSGQASYDYALVKNRLSESEIKVFPEIGEVSGFEYDFAGQLNFKTFFKDIQTGYNVKRIGIAGRLTFPAIIFNALKEIFPQAEIVDIDGDIYAFRMIKSEEEIACMDKSAQIISDVFFECMPQTKAGMTELEIQALLEASMLTKGAESYVQAFAPMVASGPENSYISMCRNTLRHIQESEIISIAAGSCYEGYNGIICTPHILGKIPKVIRDAVMCAFDALEAASAKMKPGAGAADILNTYTAYLEKYGYIEFCPYGSLHSTGLLECEAPVFSVENNREIRENMTMCIDAYFKGMTWGSFRIEDCYVIEKSGARQMTSYNKKVLPKVFGF
ncbi:MAG: Xaa-Pro peptidase family protein [Spirochaetaceae bacterium]|nr:Xaa-Pro peptidase family protein [Spirochaetaceae bacterium]